MVLDADLEKYFWQLREGYKVGVKLYGSKSIHYRMVDQYVRVNYVGTHNGTGLAGLHRALAHLTANESEGPAEKRASNPREVLELFVWEGPSDWLPPKAPWTTSHESYLGEVIGFESPRFIANVHQPSGLVCLLDQDRNQAIYWLPDASKLPYWEIAAPFKILWHAWASAFGGHLVHAAAVGKAGRGILLAGRGGSGKSTLTINCLDASWQCLGDDYVMLLPRSPARTYSLYSAAKIHTPFLDRFLPHWKPRVACRVGPENKSVIFLHESLPHAMADSMIIQAVVIPKITQQRDAKITLRSAAEGLLALAPSTIFQIPGSRGAALAFCHAWMKGLPVYSLETGRDLSSGPRVLEQLLELPHPR